MGKTGPDTAPEIKTYEYTNPRTGQSEKVPEGIDPGWDYRPGDKKWQPDMEKYPETLKTDLQGFINENTK